MANVLLGATGSVAAVRVPALHDALTADGHAVKVVATTAATYFFDPADVGPGRTRSTSDGVGEPQAPARGWTRPPRWRLGFAGYPPSFTAAGFFFNLYGTVFGVSSGSGS